MYSLILAGAFLGVYGISVKYRSYCVMCGRVPPCLTNDSSCEPKRIEGKLLNLFLDRNES